MPRFIRITPNKLNALSKYLQINVTEGNLKLEDVYTNIGVSRNAFYRIKSGRTTSVTRETYIQIEKLIAPYLDADELIIKTKPLTKAASKIEQLHQTIEMLQDKDSLRQIEISALKSTIEIQDKQLKFFKKKTTAISDAIKYIIDLKEDIDKKSEPK